MWQGSCWLVAMKVDTSTYVMTNMNEMQAQMTTTASIRFQMSRRYEPGWAITPRPITGVIEWVGRRGRPKKRS